MKKAKPFSCYRLHLPSEANLPQVSHPSLPASLEVGPTRTSCCPWHGRNAWCFPWPHTRKHAHFTYGLNPHPSLSGVMARISNRPSSRRWGIPGRLCLWRCAHLPLADRLGSVWRTLPLASLQVWGPNHSPTMITSLFPHLGRVNERISCSSCLRSLQKGRRWYERAHSKCHPAPTLPS